MNVPKIRRARRYLRSTQGTNQDQERVPVEQALQSSSALDLQVQKVAQANTKKRYFREHWQLSLLVELEQPEHAFYNRCCQRRCHF